MGEKEMEIKISLRQGMKSESVRTYSKKEALDWINENVPDNNLEDRRKEALHD